MRLDYYHSGTRAEESISLDAFRLEPGAWPGSKVNLIDTLAWGKYRLSVVDEATGETIFTRVYSSLFGEWQTTDEAASGVRRTFHESAIFPEPRSPARVSIASRRPDNSFAEIFSARLDPRSHLVERTGPPPGAHVLDVEIHAPASEAVDLLFLGDGYAAGEREKFARDVKRFADRLFSFSPFRESRARFNVRAVALDSPDSGPDEPRKGIWRDNPLGTSFNTFDTERYLTSLSNRAIRDLASAAPYDRIYVMVNSSRYGGGGIQDLFAIFTSDNEYSDYVAVHEFGHSFAGLGDEYYTSDVAYNEFYPAGVEPWEPNITALVPDGRPKWNDMVTPGVPIPTPAGDPRYGEAVGAFEGAGYAAKGLYRPSLDCQMFSKGDQPFDPVCRRALQRVIDFYAAYPQTPSHTPAEP